MRRASLGFLVAVAALYVSAHAAETQTALLLMKAGGPTSAAQAPPLLPATRDASANWKKAGLQSIGGIPTRNTQCGSTINPVGVGTDATAINNAITACTAGQFVNLGSGTFTIAEGSSVNLNKGVTLRGQGPGVTIVQHPPGQDTTNNVCNAPGAWGATVNSDCPGNSPSPVINVGSGSPATTATTSLAVDGIVGSTTIQVASTTGFVVGYMFHIDELGLGSAMPDTAFNNTTGTVWASSNYQVEWNSHNPTVGSWDSACVGQGSNGNTFSCGTNGDECAYSYRCGGVNEELHLITAIGAGPCPGVNCTVTFDSPLMLTYHVANSAAAHSFSSSAFTQQAGVENLSVAYGDAGNVVFQGCVYCWAQNVESYSWLNAGGFAFFAGAFRDQLDTFWSHNAAWPVNGGGGYSINSTYGSSENYIVNGISQLANKTIVCRASCAGDVVAYNYMDMSYIGGTDNWAEIGLNCSHLVGSHHALFEGNQTSNIDGDFTHGNDIYCTYFRNYVTGYRAPFHDQLNNVLINDLVPGTAGPIRCFGTHPYTYWTSFIGNICGIAGQMSGWTYQNNQFGGSPGPTVLKLGWNDSAVSGAGPDPAAATIYPATPTGVTASGCALDSSNPCTTIVDGNYDYFTNTINWASNDTSHTLPNSLYLLSKPAFFGTAIWPPYDPTGPTINDIPMHARWAQCQPSPNAACIFSPTPPTCTISSPGVLLSSNTVAAGLPSGTVVGSITPQTSGLCGTATLSLTGTDAASFQLSSTTPPANLQTAAILGVQSYSINIVLTISGATGSPSTTPETITGNSGSTWSPSLTNANFTLSGGNKIATLTTGGTAVVAYGTSTTGSQAQKIYFEVACNTAATSGDLLGIGITAKTNYSGGNYMGSDDQAGVYYNSFSGGPNFIVSGNFAGGSWSGCVTGDTVGVMVDQTANPALMYARTLHSGSWGANWNSTTESQPTAGGYTAPAAVSGGASSHIGLNAKIANDQATICASATCAASPSGIPTGAVWWDAAGP